MVFYGCRVLGFRVLGTATSVTSWTGSKSAGLLVQLLRKAIGMTLMLQGMLTSDLTPF
jgi:hypothetical protein